MNQIKMTETAERVNKYIIQANAEKDTLENLKSRVRDYILNTTHKIVWQEYKEEFHY